jgi:carbamoyltransferase
MATSFGRYGATHPWLGALAERVSRPLLTAYAARHGFHAPDSAFARGRGYAFTKKLRRGERIYLVGIGPAGHDTGVALIEASRDRASGPFGGMPPGDAFDEAADLQ